MGLKETPMADDIIFRCEPAMWAMLAEEGVTGIPAKPFDMRRYDLADDRIYALQWGRRTGDADCQPELTTVTFVNKASGETLTRYYLGMEFTDWAPGWCFLLLGHRVG
jgi:hypothetical protein